MRCFVYLILFSNATVKPEQIDNLELSFKSAARGADTITKSQFDQIMQISQKPSPTEDDDVAGLGFSKRTLFGKIWRLFDVDKDGVMTVCILLFRVFLQKWGFILVCGCLCVKTVE